MSRKGLSNLLPFAIILSSFNLIFPFAANAASIGTAPCVQTIDVTAGVSVYQDGNSCFIAFKSVGAYSWTPSAGVSKIDVLVVAGGGGGASRHAGGGGAGGLINSANTTINTSALSITVGSGGAGGPATGSGGTQGSNGSNSQVSGGGISSQTAIGGGGGGYNATSGSGGSSGGGGCCSQPIGTSTSGQGNLGAPGFQNGSIYVGGGGGGAGAAGISANSSGAGSGGAGIPISWMTSTAQSNLSIGQNVTSQIFFAGGGGGSTNNIGTAGSGGNGGGGAGSATTGPGTNGISNTGGGGGGGGMSGNGSAKGGDGGSGVVVIRYSIPSFTNSATFSIAENTATSVNAASITVSESSTISIRATLDYAFFTIVATDTLNAKIRFINSPDYEAFADTGANNEFDLTIRATNSSGNFQEFSIKITLTNVLEAATSGLPTISGAAYKGLPVTITISTSVPSKLRFFVGSKRIPNCLSRSTIGSYPNFTATCSWKPATLGLQLIRAIITPTDGAISPVTSAASSFLVTRRTNTR